MAGTGISSPYIKNEPGDFYSVNNNQRPMRAFPHQSLGQFSGTHPINIDPNPLGNMPGNYGQSFQNNYGPSSNRNGGFADDELLDSLGANDMHSNHSEINDIGGDFNSIDQFDFSSNVFGQSGTAPLSVEQSNIYSNTPEGDPLASPFIHNFNQSQYRLPSHNFGNSLQSPNSYSGSPIIGSELQSGTGDSLFFARQQAKIGIPNRKVSSTRSPLTPKISAISALHIGSAENGSGFPSQSTRSSSGQNHKKTQSGQWDQNSSSFNSFGGDFSPVSGVHLNAQISDVLKGTSMPTKLNNSLQTGSSGLQAQAQAQSQSQELKRRRRRESHNLVERRRRDNINERIQELSHLVPLHRLEDEKVRKALQNNSPLSPTLTGISAPPSGLSPPQATSGLAGIGARRATAGNITTGIPMEEKDKGPNKGDILNGAVSWTRDLMWMLHLKLQQQEELANYVIELGGNFPFQPSEDERRMQTELMDAMLKNDASKFHYSRTSGTGLRVPKHTDIKGDSVSNSGQAEQVNSSLSPENHGSCDAGQTSMDGAGQLWNDYNSGGSGAGSVRFKEEDEYVMDLT